MQLKNNHIHTIVLGSLDTPSDKSFESRRRVFSPAGIAPACHTCWGGGIEPKIWWNCNKSMIWQ